LEQYAGSSPAVVLIKIATMAEKKEYRATYIKDDREIGFIIIEEETLIMAQAIADQIKLWMLNIFPQGTKVKVRRYRGL